MKINFAIYDPKTGRTLSLQDLLKQLAFTADIELQQLKKLQEKHLGKSSVVDFTLTSTIKDQEVFGSFVKIIADMPHTRGIRNALSLMTLHNETVREKTREVLRHNLR